MLKAILARSFYHFLCRLAGVMLCAAPLAASSAPVIEFYNNVLDNYFITANAVEAAAIDNGSAGPGWSRTGDTFNEGGASPVCRFYGSQSPGPNSHFYTVSASECAQLKQLQATTPATQKRWNFESLDFVTTTPVNGVCPNGTVPVYRAYNNGFARGVDSNHRITTSPANIQQVVSRGWISEGVVLCGATPATVAATGQFWQQAKGVWTFSLAGNAMVIRFDGTGGYLMATTQQSPGGGERPGFERGSVAYDALTGKFNGIVIQDTNGGGGFSGRTGAELQQTLAIDGGAVVLREADGSEALRLQRVDNNQGSIVGVWAFGTTGDLATQHFVFFADGRFMMIDPIGDTEPSKCGGPGIEYGTYTWNGGTGTLTVTGVTIDSNGCAGLNEPPNATTLFGPGPHSISGIVLSDGGNTLSTSEVVLRRVAP